MKSINFILLFFLISCSGSLDDSERSGVGNNTPQNENQEISKNDSYQKSGVPAGWIQVEINSIEFLFEKVDLSGDITNGVNEQKCIFKDTAFFDLSPGDWMEDKVIKVKSDEFEITKMFVQEVTAISVDSKRLMEIPECVLSGWKRSASSWSEVQPLNNEFRFKTLDNFGSKPLSFELNELKIAIKNLCGNEWFEEFKDADSLSKISFSKTTIQYNYKIILREINSGKTLENIIVFYTPTSC